MSELMKLRKPELVDMVEEGMKQTERFADQLISSGTKIVELEDEAKHLNNHINSLKLEHQRDLKADQKAMSELKAELAGEKNRFAQINQAIDTVAAINYPEIELDLIPHPESNIEVDEKFYMLRYFKRLVAPDNRADFSAVRFGDYS